MAELADFLGITFHTSIFQLHGMRQLGTLILRLSWRGSSKKARLGTPGVMGMERGHRNRFLGRERGTDAVFCNIVCRYCTNKFSNILSSPQNLHWQEMYTLC